MGSERRQDAESELASSDEGHEGPRSGSEWTRPMGLRAGEGSGCVCRVPRQTKGKAGFAGPRAERRSCEGGGPDASRRRAPRQGASVGDEERKRRGDRERGGLKKELLSEQEASEGR